MTSLAPRGLRGRLLVGVGVIVALALVLMTAAFNVVIRHSLDGDAASLARTRAAAALATVHATGGHLIVGDNDTDDTAIGAQIWIFDRAGTIQPPRTTAQRLDAAAASLAGAPRSTIDVYGTRLYGTPIVKNGVRVGTLVTGVSLEAYEQTTRTALIGSIAFALVLFALVVAASRWLLRLALQPVADMTSAAADWSEREPGRRFARGEPYDELTSLAATLDGLLERLAVSLRREQRFSAEMSHELRTPLARIQAEVELALRRERPSEEYRAALEGIGRSAEQMTRTVDALVAAAREASLATHGSSDARTSVSRAIEATRPTGGSDAVQPRLEMAGADIRIAADEDMVERIVAPLIENACRHAAADAAVAVTQDGTSVLITVSDDGPGIDPLELESIFEPGARGHSAPGAGGAGLGLALARRLARAAGGEITAQSGPGGKFTARLPAA
jgi:two-component system OmpR family sensor kinase